jgi:hypothetical protein
LGHVSIVIVIGENVGRLESVADGRTLGDGLVEIATPEPAETSVEISHVLEPLLHSKPHVVGFEGLPPDSTHALPESIRTSNFV